MALFATAMLTLSFLLNACSGLESSIEPRPGATQVALNDPANATTAVPTIEPTYAALIAEQRSPEVPTLPFQDNPDPSQCGIPIEWGSDNQAWLSGRYEGELIQPIVFLYDSHLRLNITARAPHGTGVEIILFQQNPVVDYYFVKIKGAEPPNEGWVPAPLLSFERVPPAEISS